jgi:hypothetical protein
LLRFALLAAATIPNPCDELFEEVRHGSNCPGHPENIGIKGWS